MSLDLISKEACEALPKPIEKLIECSFNALGRLYEPRHTRKMADATAYEINVIGEALSNNFEIPIEYKSSNLSVDTKNLDDLIDRTSKRIGYQELIKQQNIENVMYNACKELDGIDSVTDEQVDNDWMIRLFNSVEDISDEDMQKLWGKVLAGEVVKPKTYSLRTLETLKNLTKDEALLFSNICSFTLSTGITSFIANDFKTIKDYNISYGDILKLDDCGLINSNTCVLSTDLNVQDYIGYNRSAMILVETKKDKIKKDDKINLSIYKLTSSGNELLNIINNKCDKRYFIDLSNNLNVDFPNVSFSVRKVKKIDDDNIECDDENLI